MTSLSADLKKSRALQERHSLEAGSRCEATRASAPRSAVSVNAAVIFALPVRGSVDGTIIVN